MTYTRGRCFNVDYCTLATSKRDIDVLVGEDFICPECARPLRPPPTKEAGGSAGVNLAIAGGGVALLLIGGGIYAGYRLSNPPSAPASRQVALAPARNAAVAPAPPPAAAAAVPSPSMPEQTVLLRLAGSSALGGGFVPKLAAAFLASLGDTGVSVQPGGNPGEMRVTGQRLSRPEAIVISLPGGVDGGTTAGLAALGRGTADVAMAARRVSQQELDGLRALGDMTSAASEHAVAFQGEAVIVNPRNPISQITMAQLAGVLSGRIARWPALGGAGQNIHLLREPGDSGLSDIVPGAPDSTPGERRVPDAAASVVADPDAVAIVPIGRVGQARVLAVAAVGAPPVLPTPGQIAGEAYPLARKLYLYTPAGGANPFAQRFAAFAASPDGQAVVPQAGLVPLTVAPVAPPAPLTPKERYKQLVGGTKRLAADLHFEANSNKLDLHSAREVDRVWNFMMSDHTPSDHLILIGFADNQGTPEANLAISRQRAQAVGQVFARRGLPPGQIVAFGSELPVADNGTEDGRGKNRRVEVYLRP